MNTQAIEVSIILPVYNGEKTLAETIQSLLDQTFTNFELIICFDGCSDGSELIVENFDDTRIKTFKNKVNMGLGRTLNRLVSLATAESKYIAMAEQDDLYYADRLAVQVEAFEKNPSAGIVSGIADFYNGKNITGQFPGILANGHVYPKGDDMFLLNFIKQVKVVNSCMMIRKEVHLNNGLYFTMHLPSISVDLLYILRFSGVSEIVGLNQSLVKLRRQPDVKSLTKNREKVFSSVQEVINLMRYEMPELVSESVVKQSETTLHIQHIKSVHKTKIPFLFFKYWIRNPKDERWFELLKKFLK